MLIEFSVGNYKSIKNIETLSMSTSNLQPKYPHLKVDNIFDFKDDFKLLKSKAIYGANASGKSNIFKALESFIKIIDANVGIEKTLESNINPFKLCDQNEKEPTFYQIQFLRDNVTFRYGFVADRTKIHSEWLFKKVDRETALFTRENEEFEVNKSQFSEGKILKDIFKKSDDVLVKDNYLYLTFIGRILHGKTASELLDFITKRIVLVSGLDSYRNKKNAENFIENEKNKEVLVSLVKAADMGIDNIDYILFDDEKDKSKTDKKLSDRQKLIYAVKKQFDKNNEEIAERWMGFDFEESKGTQKMFELAPYIIDSLNNGSVLFIDEFDSRFHSKLTKKIIELFNSKSNTKGQLIFITHDTNLLSSKLLRRDQISFAQRDKYGASHFYSLAEFKGVRNSSSYENDYIHGKYGAIPSLGDFEEIFLEDAQEN